MRQLSYILILLFALNSCAGDSCSYELSSSYPEIEDYMNEHDLNDYTSISCSSNGFQSYTFHGYQEPGGKCSFFEVDLEVGNILIDTFTFYKNDKRLYDIVAYQLNEEDHEKLINFIPDASLYFEKNKEVHEFFVGDNNVYLYYFGFP